MQIYNALFYYANILLYKIGVYSWFQNLGFVCFSFPKIKIYKFLEWNKKMVGNIPYQSLTN